MGYSARPTNGKKRSFKLLLEKRVKEEATGELRKKCKGIPFEQWGIHGFHPNMTLEQARAKASALNAIAEEKRHAARKVAIAHRIAKEETALAVFVGDEAEFKTWCEEDQRIEFKGANKFDSHWHCTKKVLKDTRIEPAHYYAKRKSIYFWFKDRGLSIAYLKKILRFLNLYGEFIAQKYGTYFKPVPYPTGRDKQDVANASRKNPTRKNKKAKPLSPGVLESAKGRLSVENYNWIYLSLWLGLRPGEVDNLKSTKLYAWEETEEDGDTFAVLAIYQTKLERTLDEEDRWKRIPILYQEQERIRPIIESGKFERPLVSTMRNALKDSQYGTYSGRKGFEEILEKKGQPFHFISAMLGHRKPDITYQKYMNRTKARFINPKKRSA